MSSKDAETLQGELINLRRDFEACRAASGGRHTDVANLIRAYREERLREAGMTGVYPLWARDTRSLARDMIDSGLVAHLTCIDPRVLDPSFAGRRFDAGLLADLPDGVDPCGENGEFHTVVTGGPMFSAPITVSIGEVVERDGFVFADVIPA